ncbi:HugZ family pyridoxamine 5'-phosphate oxidase [Oceanibium sediminis]|uniref:HugZ family pyridoxamine 5'-phosphate oxidase n=1 Tax=Oceanibium sediminis TaxID=2026339 RepID=UPI000DD35799|nr:pyridoxamine 5'-phosphate oxidase family protein [Oceanibium sediminis]
MPDPGFLSADDTARAMARTLLDGARTAALGVLGAGGAPSVTKVGFAYAPDVGPLTLISDLSPHTACLRDDPRASLLVEGPVERGDPMNAARLTLACVARFLPRDSDGRAAARAAYLERNPKAALYIDFGDFHLVSFEIRSAHLNGGFGKAYALTAGDFPAASS